MLVEFEAMIHWAFARPERAQRLCDELVTYRDVAMHRYGHPPPDVPPTDNLLLHADAVSRLYLETKTGSSRKRPPDAALQPALMTRPFHTTNSSSVTSSTPQNRL